MGRMTLKQKSISNTFFICLMIVLLYIISIVLFFKNPKIDKAQIRMDYSNFVSNISSGNYNIDKDFAIIDLTGEVTYSTIDYYKVGDKINLSSINNMREYYVSALTDHDIIIGNLFICLNYAEYEYYNYVSLVISTIILIMAMAISILYFMVSQKDIFRPILDIHKETKEIAKGNYDYELKYDYLTEVGSLSHDIEALRDELKDSTLREKKLKDNEKLLLACISHDLKTPVATISGYAEGIRDGVCKNEEQIKKYCEIILHKTKVLTKLVDDILEHSNLELNEFSINLEEVYAKKFFNNVFNDLKEDIIKNDLELAISDCPDVLLSIDKKRIHQVVSNIISNSVKYTNKGGKITVTFLLDSKLRISIADNGKGIDAADIPFVFDKFFRSEKARTQNIPGSGLGLNICKYIILKHNGEIECDSLLNEGTTIMFSLPIVK